MKTFVRRFLISLVTIYLLTLINPGFSYSGGYKTLLLAGFVMFFLDTIVRPILNVILLPINFLTLGLFRWVIAVALFYALTYFVPAIRITGWTFEGYSLPILTFYTLTIPAYTFNFLTNLVFLSFLFNLISGIFTWLCEE